MNKRYSEPQQTNTKPGGSEDRDMHELLLSKIILNQVGKKVCVTVMIILLECFIWFAALFLVSFFQFLFLSIAFI